MYQVTRVTRLITVAICVRRLRNECDVVVFWSMNNSARAKFVFDNRHYIMHILCMVPAIPTVVPSICDSAVGRTKSSSGGGRTNTSGCVYMRHLVGHNKHNNNSIILQFLATKHTRFAQWRRGQRHIRRALLRRFSRTI